MQLTDIIRSDSDRLFIVDTECFIIFTGSSINDDRPFIRIGTWYDLPVEIIPLVENVIVSDRIMGNPSYEQFNIDVRNLEANRYIGGESILKRFLEYQRIFGLDLTNVSLVNIEKDIPELSSQKNVSHRDQFIGVFYSDGNIKIEHGRRNIFDLNIIRKDNIDHAEILSRISANSKGTERYRGSGIVIIDNNPIFYHNEYFTSYQFPDRCLNDFSALQIDPARIRELLLPSQNLINISGFMKFKNSRGGKIKLCSDNSEQIELIKKLFKNAIVTGETFSGLDLNTPEGLRVISYPDSPNIRLSFRQGADRKEDISIPFIKSPSDTSKILKEKSDAIIITYTAYEESALLFKSTEVPVIMLDDGNHNIRKVSDPDKIILKPGIQYDIRKLKSFEELTNEFSDMKELIEAVDSSDKERIVSVIETIIGNGEESIAKYNIPPLLKAYMGETSDRRRFSMLRDVYQSYSRKLQFAPDSDLRSSITVTIAIHSNNCYAVIRKIPLLPSEIFIDDYSAPVPDESSFNTEQRALRERINEDRERLNRLLKLFYTEISGKPSFSKIEKEMSLLKNEISARKDIYTSEFYSVSGKPLKRKSISGILKPWKKGDEAAVPSNEMFSIREIMQNRDLLHGKRKLIPVAAILIIAAIALLLYLTRFRNSETKPVLTEAELKSVENRNVVVTVKRVNSEEKELLKKHKVKISESDIWRYSNDVAVKNGYSRITFTGLKEKNPNWIYPSNVFIMHDGEKVVVQKGDTLWDLCHAKLEKMNADFYSIIDRVENSDPSDKQAIRALLEEAGKYSYIKQQTEILESYKKRFSNE